MTKHRKYSAKKSSVSPTLLIALGFGGVLLYLMIKNANAATNDFGLNAPAGTASNPW